MHEYVNLWDRVVSYFSPGAGVRRAKNRVILSQIRKYEAGSHSKRTRNFMTSRTSADVLATVAGPLIRERARYMERNNAYIRRAVKIIRTNVAGTGVKLGLQSTRKRQLRVAKSLWKTWAESTDCDFMGRKNLYAIQRLVVSRYYVDGEVFVRFRRNSDPRNPIQLQVLEADYLDTTRHQITSSVTGNIIDHGIELDPDGRKVAYYFYRQHPHGNDLRRQIETVRVPADEVLHIYYEERPGQLRGVSEMAASIIPLRDFAEYEDAQLIRQKIAACFTAFVTGPADPRPSAEQTDGSLPLERVEPGIIEYLPPDKSVTFGNPPETNNYDEYARTVLRGAAAGLGLSYESFTGDLSNVNFSSARMGWLDQSRFIREIQDDILITQLLGPAWREFLRANQIAGNLAITARYEVSWTPPRREMIDPSKEVGALVEMVRAGFESKQSIIRQLGNDPEQLSIEIAADMSETDRLGSMPTTDPRYDPKRAGPEEDSDGENAGATSQ